MPKRTLAALGVVLAFAAVLGVVPLATADEAEAHSRTKTVQRCSYDPFAGQQCWNETVNVSHVHRCGAGLTGTYPNCYPIPPATQPVCPAGMTGTPPNCYPPPPATTEPPPPPTTQPPPPTTTAPPPPPTTQPPPPTTTQPPKCPAGQTGTPPNCKTERDTQRCATGYHRYGTGCHANHDYSNIPCGTGTWAPHAGHTPKQQTPCEPKKKPKDDELPADCSEDEHQHLNLFGIMSGCHDDTPGHNHTDGSKDKPCPQGYQWNGSTCELTPDIKLLRRGVNLYFEVEGQVLCTYALGGAVTKVANRILKGVSGAARAVFGHSVEVVVESPCDEVWDKLQTWIMNGSFGPETVDPEDDSDSDSDDSGPPTDADVREAEQKWRRGEIDGDELSRIQNERDCAQGWADACAALGR